MEIMMQFVWRHRLWPSMPLTGTDGECITIIDPGLLNTGSGPDFFNAKVQIDNRVWVGNVEIHVYASDWYAHGHDTDPAYDNVILHVVQYDDRPVTRRTDGEPLVQVTMPSARLFMDRYDAMMRAGTAALPCAQTLSGIAGVELSAWVTTLAMERLQRKASNIRKLLDDSGGDWLSATYITLARALGFGTNADAMERVARAVPLRILLKHSNSTTAMEAILLGAAGLLNDPPRDEYEELLLREYRFYRIKYALPDNAVPVWNRRLRPANSPARRVAAMAAMVKDGFGIGSQLMAARTAAEAIFQLRRIDLSPYWHNHIMPGTEGTAPAAAISGSGARLVCINTVAPLLYAMGEASDNPDMCEGAMDMLEQLPAEDNAQVRTLSAAGLPCRNAWQSQGLLQLRTCYCDARKCLQCRIGHRTLSAPVGVTRR